MDQLSSRLLRRGKFPVAMLLLMGGDILAVLGALALSLALRIDGMSVADIVRLYFRPHALSLGLSLAFYVVIFASFRLYRYAWRFASLNVAKSVVSAVTIGMLAMVFVQTLLDGGTFPTRVLIIFWMTSFLFVGGVRIVLRIASLGSSYGPVAVRLLQRDLRPRRVVILGGGSNGARLLNALRDELGSSYDVLGFLDDHPHRQGVYIRDVRVLGPLGKLYDMLAEREVDEVLIALPEASGADIREYVMACRKRKVPVKVIPAVQDVLNGKAHPHVEEISVEDLLRRPPVRINIAEVGDLVGGKRVLVTGAGGSIGSELCRQIIALDPALLILLGHGENSIHKIHSELCGHRPDMAERLRIVIASVADEARVNHVFDTHRPQVVFHAAAHKHVPLMETNVLEAVQNNVLGTSILAEACGRYGVDYTVLISTDKAIYPSSVMGATKWLCERVVRAMVVLYRDTNYVTVRFGNVLGSRGSVVPLFHDQIKRGGPVTVTHPEMTRYFMSIPEAVQLVLQAGAAGKSGELYLLDMGQPVRILDLAHDMIRLCGYEPDKDIPVKFTGCRPGEKLHEKLTADDETLEPAFCKGLSIVRHSNGFGTADVMDLLRRAHQILNRGDEEEMRELLNQVVPGFSDLNLVYRPSAPAPSSPTHSA